MISIIHPSRGRPEKSFTTISKWLSHVNDRSLISLFVICDSDDTYLSKYKDLYSPYSTQIEGSDRSVKWSNPVFVSPYNNSVSAINFGAKLSTSYEITKDNILMVVSDDTECFPGWDTALLKAVEGKIDWILKTKDDIQDYIITFPIMDGVYFNRTGYIYHPGFDHMFCDTYMTCVADITGRKITSDLVFHHDNPGHFGKPIDDINRKNDATWKQGQETFIRLMNQFSIEERRRITDKSMRNWLRNKGVQI